MKTFMFRNETFPEGIECCLEYYRMEKLIEIYSITDTGMWEDFFVATTTPENIVIPEDCVVVRSYKINGVLDALVALGVIEVLYPVRLNLAQGHMCRVTKRIYDYAA